VDGVTCRPIKQHDIIMTQIMRMPWACRGCRVQWAVSPRPAEASSHPGPSPERGRGRQPDQDTRRNKVEGELDG